MSTEYEKKASRSEAGPHPELMVSVHTELQKSIAAEEIICSIGSQMIWIPATQSLSGLSEVNQENCKTSLHRITAAGCLKRMAQGDWHETLLAILVHSLYNARQHDQLRRGHTQRCWQSASSSLRPSIENWMSWLRLAEDHLQQTMVLAQQLVGTRRWSKFLPEGRHY